jgi:hypothetical protein
MRVMVVKEPEGKMSLLVVSEGRPPLPPVAVMGLPVKEVYPCCLKVLGEVERARKGAMAEGSD